MRHNLIGWRRVNGFEIDWEKSPQRIRAGSIQDTFIHFMLACIQKIKQGQSYQNIQHPHAICAEILKPANPPEVALQKAFWTKKAKFLTLGVEICEESQD